MSIESLHNQVDDLQADCLEEGIFTNDTAIEDLAYRSVDNFQQDIRQFSPDIQEEACIRLVEFFNEFIEGGNEFDLGDLQALFELLNITEYTKENESLANGLPILGKEFTQTEYDALIDSLLFDTVVFPDDDPEVVIHMMSFMVSEFISKSRGLNIRGQSNVRVEKMSYEKRVEMTRDLYEMVYMCSEEGYEEKAQEIIIQECTFGVMLSKELGNSQISERYSDPKFREKMLEQYASLEEQEHFLKLWDFCNSDNKTQTKMLGNDSHFASHLRKYGIEGYMENLDIPLFSESPEVVAQKIAVYDYIFEKCEGQEYEEVLALYAMYLENIGESSVRVEDYLQKLTIFEEMLHDEFRGSWDIGTFVARLVSLGCSLGKFTKALDIIKNLRRGREYLRKNMLESSIVAASFCPYAGNCIDMGYGAYKLCNGENLSGEVIHEADAITQLGFGVVGMGMDILLPGSSTVLKTLKLAARGSAEIQVIAGIGKGIASFIPEIVKIFKKFQDNMLVGLSELKAFFINKILPSISDDIIDLSNMLKASA